MTDHLTTASEFMRLLEIEFDERGPTRVTGSVAADERHHQPWGLVHGGLYTTVIETFATTGAFEAVKDQGMQAVGVSNLTDFLRPHRERPAGRRGHPDPPGAHAAALAGRDPPARRSQADRPRPGQAPERRVRRMSDVERARHGRWGPRTQDHHAGTTRRSRPPRGLASPAVSSSRRSSTDGCRGRRSPS